MQLGQSRPTTIEEFLGRLRADGAIDGPDLERLHAVLARGGGRLVDVVTQLGLVPEGELTERLAAHLGLGLVGPDEFPAEPVAQDRLSDAFLIEARALPLAETGAGLAVAVADPFDEALLAGLQLAARQRIVARLAAPSALEAALKRLYGREMDRNPAADSERIDQDLDSLKDSASNAPIVKFINALIARAVAARASDIHLLPTDRRLRIRLRIDGVLQEIESAPLGDAAALISRLKILAGLDIAERRLPQDGSIKTVVQGREVDLRLAVVPTVHGEAAVVRLLDRNQVALDIDALGFDGTTRDRLLGLFRRPNGIILVTGPTGSGKSTTLYAALHRLNGPERNIITVEDPVENKIPGVAQIQVKTDIGLSFARILRSVLRHDPDVILIGEIRDPETARIATQAAMTGHLVLATLHTNSAAGAVSRLLDMGVESYLLSSTLVAVLSQRLVRVLCPSCRVEDEDGQRAVGCPSCNQTGYRGRRAIHELLTVDDAVRRAIVAKATAQELEGLAVAGGMETLRRCGMRRVADGLTTAAEIARVIVEEG